MKLIRSMNVVLLPALVLAFCVTGAQANVGFKVIHSFNGDDGAIPYGGVAPAPHGGFYVATLGGGSSNGGALTLINKDGTSRVLHSFTGGNDGQSPFGTPFRWSVDGNIYGTTEEGGASSCGTIYRYAPRSGAYQQLYAFRCSPDGAYPVAALNDIGGVLESTANGGGSHDVGALIFVRSDGSAGTSCSFSGNDGDFPDASVAPANGNYYTIAHEDDIGYGTVTEFHGVTCNTSVIHRFASGSDGAFPSGSLLFYNNALYGTTVFGGGPNLGTVFRVNLDGSNYAVLHSFQGICCGNSDGSFPESALTLNPNDNMLYGTTTNGGNSSDLGTVFKIDPNTGTETVVHSFSGTDGANPTGDLYIRKGNIYGTIYGTTQDGGAHNAGVVFRLKT
ncbi:MAG TPA: choice-of-anchor tandem repeat GloVer-containing protein [Rhizomicrobium sp.]|jgi:uncharacterized repeat protein (TIGR03803 family)|nr:choice-of-anchor tandem repeat GloVer-containing protein [Rhizomicrobium sp.]